MKFRPVSMKVLVCIIGTLRGGSKPANSLDRHILRPFNADLALCIGRCGDHIYKDLAKYVWEFDEPEDWSSIWDETGTGWRRIERDLYSGMWGGIESPPASLLRDYVMHLLGFSGHGSGAIILALRHLLKKQLLGNSLVSEYDRFIITRSDHIYLNARTPLGPGIHVPVGEDYGGITDRHMVVDSDNVIAVLSVLDYLNAELPPVDDRNPERVLHDYYRYLGLDIRRYPRNLFTVALPEDETRWKKPRHSFDGTLRLKYASEYDQAKNNIRHRLRRFSLSIAKPLLMHSGIPRSSNWLP